jgi:hypothetical protein
MDNAVFVVVCGKRRDIRAIVYLLHTPCCKNGQICGGEASGGAA